VYFIILYMFYITKKKHFRSQKTNRKIKETHIKLFVRTFLQQWGSKRGSGGSWVVKMGGWNVEHKAGGSKTCAGGQKRVVVVKNAWLGVKMSRGGGQNAWWGLKTHGWGWKQVGGLKCVVGVENMWWVSKICALKERNK
jgi:hypothetical protein